MAFDSDQLFQRIDRIRDGQILGQIKDQIRTISKYYS